MDAKKLRSNLVTSSVARLMPVIADSKKEERATSMVLAAFIAIPDFAHAVLSEAGAPLGKRSKIQCFTEVSFKGDNPKIRPDGLIIITTGSKKMWSALVESKVGRNDLSAEQIETYMDIAKSQGIDALITISNQFASLPVHHPVKVSKQRLRYTGLYHFSWLSILSKAFLLTEGKAIDDVEQAYILSELVRYLRHDSSQVTGGLQMGSGWKEVCTSVHQGVALHKNSDEVTEAVASWHQLQKYLSIQLSVALNKAVKTSMSKKHTNNPELRLQDDISLLTTKHSLSAVVDVPNAAGKIEIKGDLLRKTLNLSIRLDAPGDAKRQTTSINWLARQLAKCNLENLVVTAYWPRRIPPTSLTARLLLEEGGDLLLPPNVKDTPVSFEIIRIVDLGAKFKSVKGFVEIAEGQLINFYKDVCQNLIKWVPKPPKVKEPTTSLSKPVQSEEEKLLDTLTGISKDEQYTPPNYSPHATDSSHKASSRIRFFW